MQIIAVIVVLSIIALWALDMLMQYRYFFLCLILFMIASYQYNSYMDTVVTVVVKEK